MFCQAQCVIIHKPLNIYVKSQKFMLCHKIFIFFNISNVQLDEFLDKLPSDISCTIFFVTNADIVGKHACRNYTNATVSLHDMRKHLSYDLEL